MFNRSCSVDFLVPHFWAAFLTLNPLSRTSLNCLGKGSCQVTILRITTKEKACIKFDVFLPFPLTPLE